MEIFWILLAKLVPLYLMIGLGYIASRFLAAQKETFGRILIYIITPAVVFYGTATANLDAGNLLLPLVFFAVACANCLLFLGAGKRAFNGRTEKNILAFAAGSANVGYFGLPVALALFDSQIFAMAVLSVMGLILYENTVGFLLLPMAAMVPAPVLQNWCACPRSMLSRLGCCLTLPVLTLAAWQCQLSIISKPPILYWA